MIRISSLPYFLVILASLLPWAAAYFDSKFIALAPDLLMLVVFAALVMVGRVRISVRPLAVALLALIAIHSVIGLADGRGIGSGGLVLLILEIFVFYKFLGRGDATFTDKKALLWVSRIYQLHLVFLAFELAGRLAGLTDFFVAIAGYSTVTTIYKTYNSAALLNYFGMSGLNSMLLGSQSASQLVLFAGLWFLYMSVAVPAAWREPSSRWWFAVACAMYPLNATMTSNLLLVFMLGLLLLAFRRRRTSTVKIIAIGSLALILALVIGDVAYEILLFRIDSAEGFLIYREALDIPIEVYSGIGLYRQLLGWGAYIDEFIISDTNFGLLGIFFQVGLLLSFVCMVCVVMFVRLLMKVRTVLRSEGAEVGCSAYLAIINGLLALGWFGSLVHYTPAVELGGRHLFAFHVALGIFFSQCTLARAASRARARSERTNSERGYVAPAF